MPIEIYNLSGNFTIDTDAFGKMDPYLEVNIGGPAKKTTVQNGAGKTPKWPDILCFHEKGNILTIVVKDDDVGKDDLVGEGKFDITQAYNNPNKPATFNVNTFVKNQATGYVTLTCVWKP